MSGHTLLTRETRKTRAHSMLLQEQFASERAQYYTFYVTLQSSYLTFCLQRKNVSLFQNLEGNNNIVGEQIFRVKN